MTYHLISWGANSHGQLGQNVRSEECLLPRVVDLSKCSLAPERIKKIVGGAGHTLMLDNDGRVYSCGWNNKGQAGFPEKEDILIFRVMDEVLKNKKITDIACGWDSSAALTVEGTLYVWGSNYYGQLGKHQNNLRWTHEPFEMTLDRRIEGVSMGLRHTALVTHDHKVLVSGSGSKGQLGLESSENNNPANNAHAFKEVPELTNVQSIVCGQHHTIALTREKDIFAFGDNKHGQLGLDPKILTRSLRPIKLDSQEFDTTIEIHSGWSHVVLLTDGKLFSWGRNTYGQLGRAENERQTTWNITKVENLANIRQVTVGSEHNIAITDAGKILCWGWNEHGNCGNGYTRDVRSPEELSLEFKYIAILVGSGAGHSLAVIKKIVT